jgi:hypothetical protein
MIKETTVKTPVHIWIVGILSVLWNAVGAFDYIATQYRLESYMSQFTPEQLEYFYGFPVWMDAAWAIAVWGSLLASFGLLLRKAWSASLFGVAIAGLAATSVYSGVLTNGMAIMGSGATKFTALIWVIALFLYFYSRAMAERKVLR